MSKFDDFKGCLIAHRGLHDNQTELVENSLAAFAKAVEAGYGIELDVRLTKDDELIVAHDDETDRLLGLPGNFRELTFEEITQHGLLGSNQRVPLFSQVLEVIGGRVPLVVEIKPASDDALTCELTDQALAGYDGPYCVESFDPRVLLWYRRHRPGVLRGQLSENYAGQDAFHVPLLGGALTKMLFNPLTWPGFIAYNWRDAALPSPHFWRRVLRCPLVAWTIESQAQLDAARHSFDAYIFQGFTPDATS